MTPKTLATTPAATPAPKEGATGDGNETSTTLAWSVPASHPAFAGHFPGQPLLPGALLLAEALEAALARPALAALLGPGPTLSQAKFLAPVLPGSTLSLRLTPTPGGRLAFEIRCGERLAASGQFSAAAPPRPAAPTPAP